MDFRPQAPHLFFHCKAIIITPIKSLSDLLIYNVFLYYQVEEPPAVCGEIGTVNSVNVELSKETLDTMLDGLGKIRDQLNSVAKTQQS